MQESIDEAATDDSCFRIIVGYGLWIDAGGTCTDAAIYDFTGKYVQSKNKALTAKWYFSISIDNALVGLDQSFLHRVEMVSEYQRLFPPTLLPFQVLPAR